MKITTIQGESSIQQLAQRLFGDAAKTRPDIVERLLDANPHLADVSALPPGTAVVVPQVASAPSVGDDQRVQTVVGQIDAVVAALETRGHELLARRRQVFQRTANLTTNAEVLKTAADADKTALSTLGDTLKQSIADVDAQTKAFADGIAAVRTALHPPQRRRPSRPPAAKQG